MSTSAPTRSPPGGRSSTRSSVTRLRSHKGGVQAYLSERNPQWRLVGRVTFHLAENKRDPEHPFAFLATYIPRLSAQGRVQHEPLGKALQQYAGAKNRSALLSLLVPIQRATERSPLVKEMVESGEIYHPLAWTPREAYRFLQDIPVFEESGLVVRVPDWWKASRPPRPVVNVKIDARKGSRLGVDSLARVLRQRDARRRATHRGRASSSSSSRSAAWSRSRGSGSRSTARSWPRPWSTGRRSSATPERAACRSMRECGCLPECPRNATPQHPSVEDHEWVGLTAGDCPREDAPASCARPRRSRALSPPGCAPSFGTISKPA